MAYDKDDMDKVLKDLEQGIKDVFTSDKFRDYLITMSKFHRYSINNIMWLHMQNPKIEQVAGYNTWKRVGRQVIKGEKALKVLAPMQVKKKEMKLDPSTKKPIVNPITKKPIETIKNFIVGFKAASVFDVSQTEGKELPSLANELNSKVDKYDLLKQSIMEVSEYPIKFIKTDGGCKGYFDQSIIAVNEGMSEAQSLKTMIHELAHSRLHAIDKQEDGTIPLSREQKETEAESVAYVVCNKFGLDTSDYSFEYLATWSNGKELLELKGSLETIKNESNKIIDEIETKLEKKLNISKDVLKSDEKENFKNTSKEKSTIKNKLNSSKSNKTKINTKSRSKNVKDKER